MAADLELTVDKFTFRVPTDRRYSRDGVWVLPVDGANDPHVRVGLSDFVQQHNGDLAFASVKRAGTRLRVGEELAEVETVKVNLSVPAPVSGVIATVNPALEQTPEVVNRDPYGDGWLAVLEGTSLAAEATALLDAPAYLALMQGQVEQELTP